LSPISGNRRGRRTHSDVRPHQARCALLEHGSRRIPALRQENPQQTEAFLKGTIDGLAFLPNPANEKAVKNVLARRLKLTTPQSIQVMYDTTLEIHAKTKVPNAPVAGVQNMIDVLLRINPRLAKLKAAELIDSSFIERLEKSGYIKEAMKRSG
jgi:hypothetical protein